MWLEELAEYIRAQNVEGIGDNVYIFTMKESDVGAMLTSHNDGISTSPELPNYYKGPMQLIVRSTKPQNSLDQAMRLRALLDSNISRVSEEDIALILPHVKFNYLYARHFPVVYPRSDGNFYEASINFDVCFVALDTI